MKKALLVGINQYPQPVPQLKGCVNDARKMAELLERHGDCVGRLNYECEMLIGEGEQAVTRELFLAKLENLFSKPSDGVLLYFSGHGSRNLSGGYLITSDCTREQPGISFRELVDKVNQSDVRDITIILDCCHSGDIGRSEGNGKIAEIREGVSILSACSGDEFAKEDNTGGIFTSTVVSALKGQAADILGNITIAGIYAHADKLLSSWEQRPIFKANVRQLRTIRRVKGKTTDRQLLRLKHFFKSPNDILKLDASFEKHKCEVPEGPLKDRYPEKEKELKELQDFRAAGLVEPISHDNLYDTCIQSGTCELTPIGKFYWHMVEKKKI